MICGASSLAAASIYSVEGLAGLFGRVIFGTLADRIGVKRVIIGGLVLQAVGIYSYVYVSGLSDFYIRAVVLGMAYGGVMPLYSILAREYFPQNLMGTVLGGITMTSSIGMAFGPVGGGWLFDTFGTYHWLYVASAGIGIAAAAMALAFPAAAQGRIRRRQSGAGQCLKSSSVVSASPPASTTSPPAARRRPRRAHARPLRGQNLRQRRRRRRQCPRHRL